MDARRSTAPTCCWMTFFSAARSFAAKALLLVGYASLLAGCADGIFGSTKTPESESTLKRIANNYLTNIIVGNEKQFADMVNWRNLLSADGGQLTAVEFQLQWDGCQRQFGPLKNSPKEHPLQGLEVTDISVHGNDAKIELRKNAEYVSPGAKSEKIWIKFLWEGTGWVVQEDSLFGKGKFCAQYALSSAPAAK